LGFFAAFAAASNWSASAFETVSTRASYSVMPYSFTRRARRASGSSGKVLVISAFHFASTTNGSKSGSGK
jgi:hypothetical protein